MTLNNLLIKKLKDGSRKVEVKVDLCTYYRAIIEDLPVEADNKFRLYLNMLTWGSFYIESAMNNTLAMVVEDSVQGILTPEDVVRPLERSILENKVTLLLNKLCNDAEQKSKLRSATLKLFELRNRFVHPKEKPESTNLKISAPEQIGIVEAAQEIESDLEGLMYSIDITERKQQILEIGGWFENSIFEYYKRKDA
jgi:hypothetical protein